MQLYSKNIDVIYYIYRIEMISPYKPKLKIQYRRKKLPNPNIQIQIQILIFLLCTNNTKSTKPIDRKQIAINRTRINHPTKECMGKLN